MNCRDFERHLDAISDETAPEALRREAARHAQACASCRELEALARASLSGSAPVGPDFTREVMSLTSGPACAGAALRLAELAGEAPSGPGRDLIRSHLETCAACADLAATLEWMAAELPAMAAIDPGESFTVEVMRRTLRARPRTVSLRHAPARWWAALASRPRFAWEAAYVGAFACWLLFGAAFAPFHQVPGRALELARVNPVRAFEDTVQPATLSRQVWESTGARVMQSAESTGAALSGRASGLTGASASLIQHGAGALGSALRGDLSGSAVRLKDMGADLREIWQELRGRGVDRKPGSQEA